VKNLELNNSTYAEPEAAGSDLIPLVMRLLRILRHRKRVIFATIYCFALAGASYYFLATRYYQSSAKLLIVEQNLDQLSSMGESDGTGNTMATHRELVISPVVIQSAIQQLATQHRIDLHGIPAQNQYKSIAKRLNAKVTRNTNFIDVSYRSKSPEAASAVVNAVIQSYLEFVERHHKGTAGEILAVLTNERELLQQSLDQKQNELQRYRQQVGHLAISSNDGVIEPMIQRALKLNESLLTAQEKRLRLQTNLTSIESSLQAGEDVSQQLMGLEEALGRQILLSSMGFSPQDLQVVSQQQKNLFATKQELLSLSADFGPNHPRVIELEQQIKNLTSYLSTYHSDAGDRLGSLGTAVQGEAIVNMLRQSVRQAKLQEQQLLTSFEQARSEASKHSEALVKLRMLERDVIRKESLYDSLSEKIAGIDISQVQAPIKATIVREPAPNRGPVTPQLRFVAAICLLGGSFIGTIIVYVQEVLDDRFNSPEELSAQLGVPVLAMVRNLAPLPGQGLETVHTHTLPTDVETEAFRTLRTSLSLSSDICDRILISSSEPGDGKTTISANLSVAFAQAGKRTLVIDADLRRPGLSALFNLKGHAGVADVLASDQAPQTTAPGLIHKTDIDKLDILPVGLRRPNPAELLSSNAFVELLAWADSQYDRVIVDCPPVLAVSDAQIVGQLVDGAILVVRPEKNHRKSVTRAVDSFRASGCRLLGIVANGISSDSSEYGYAYGYGDSYGHDENTDLENQEQPSATMPPWVYSISDSNTPSLASPPASAQQETRTQTRRAS
jgi:capsular exopolysaccharide synthesis family protein